MNARHLIKKYTPKALLRLYRRINPSDRNMDRRQIFQARYQRCSDYDNERMLAQSNAVLHNDTAEKLLSEIIIVYHTIEKGLTMGEMRPGFGSDRLKELIDLCDLYLDRHGDRDENLLGAIGVIAEYDRIHKAGGHVLPAELQGRIDGVLQRCPAAPEEQPALTRTEYFAQTQAPFDLFSKSRHSLRDFAPGGSVSVAALEQAIELAQQAPSTCNRQSVRVHLLVDKPAIEKMLKLQKGSRGFGERVDKLIVLTADLQGWGSAQARFGPYVDVGIYAMNLLYALHFFRIGACALNWYVEIDDDLEARATAAVPPNEVIGLLIACGAVKEEFKVAKSRRRDYRSILKIHR